MCWKKPMCWKKSMTSKGLTKDKKNRLFKKCS